MFLMGDNWEKACRGNVVSVRAWQSGLNPVCQCHRTAYYLNSPRRWHFYSFYFINATQTTIGCDNQLWLGDTPPIVRTGPISLIICGVCSALWKAGGGRSTLTAPQGLWLLGPAPPPANFYPQLTSRCLPPECVPSSSHLLCSSTLTYCLEAGNARHSGLAWALCLRSSRRYLVDHRPVEIFERQNGLAEILLCYQQIFRHFRLESDTKTLEINSNNIWEQYSCSERWNPRRLIQSLHGALQTVDILSKLCAKSLFLQRVYTEHNRLVKKDQTKSFSKYYLRQNNRAATYFLLLVFSQAHLLITAACYIWLISQ